MQSSSATASGEVRREGTISEVLNTDDVKEAITALKAGKFVLPTLKKVMDAILFEVALEINYSSIHPYYTFRKGIRSQDKPITEEDILEGGCCYPNMDCVGSAYYVRHKILTTVKLFDEECALEIYAFANGRCLENRKGNEYFMSLSR
jgi:hypothetical protein